MPLFEHMPYTNFENINLDWILKTIKTHQTDIDQLKADVGDMKTTIINIQGDITTIYETIEGLDIDSILSRIGALEDEYTLLHNNLNTITLRVVADEEDIAANTAGVSANGTAIANNDLASQNRDNALSARITQLERATIHDIYNYYGETNQCIFGSDLRHLPSEILDDDGYPIVGWGNKYNANQAGTSQARSFKFIAGGMVANTDYASYDYFQVGKYTNGLGINGHYTVTLALVTADDATPTWYSHTFNGTSEQWTIASNCVIKIRKFYNWDDSNTNHLVTVAFCGTAANWNTFLNGKKIAYIFVENGTGTVDTSSTSKPEYSIKDREFFIEQEAQDLPEQTIVGTGSGTASVTYYDLVGEPQTINSTITATVTAKKYGKVIDGYINIRMGLSNNIGDILARGMNFTLTGLALTYDAVNLPMPSADSPLRGSANDSKYYAWAYNNTQNTYVFVNVADNGTWNIKAISSGMQNYTGSYDSYTDFRLPIKFIAA